MRMRVNIPLWAIILNCVLWLSVATLQACTPAEVKQAERVIPETEHAVCVILRAIDKNGTVQEICATADELAPYIPDLLSQRDAGAPEHASGLAFALETAPHTPRKYKRHCIGWISSEIDRDAAHE